MKSFQQKGSWKSILQSKPVLVFLIILVLFFTYGVFRFMGKMELTRENRKIAENKLLELENKKEKLLSDIAKLNTQSGVEESIRSKFGLAKEGEGVIVVVPDKEEVEAPKKESEGFWAFFTNWFR